MGTVMGTMRRVGGLRCAIVVLAVMGMLPTAFGQFLVVPEGQQAGRVTPKAMIAELRAFGAYATVRLELAFAIDPNWNDEVDFLMRLPENVDATGFAYWFEEEKVIARTVKKERAAEIYRRITERRRDPALVELVGRRQFRVRIAPVDVTKDLRVEIRLVITPTRGALTLPLTALVDQPLQTASLSVEVPNTTPAWTENWGRALEPTTRGTRQASATFRNWRPSRDWRVAPPRNPAQPGVLASVGRPATGDGTLIFSYTAPRDLRQLRLVAPAGVLHSVYPRSPQTVRAGQTLTWVARISPLAPAQTTLRLTHAGGTLSVSHAFPRAPMADRAGVVAWGLRHVEQLRSRAEIVRWGMLLNVPTKETSWLAVPQAERAALNRAKAEIAARDYWLAWSKWGEDAKRTIHLKEVHRQIVVQSIPPGKTPQEVELAVTWSLEQSMWEAEQSLTERIVEIAAAGRLRQPSGQAYVRRLNLLFGYI